MHIQSIEKKEKNSHHHVQELWKLESNPDAKKKNLTLVPQSEQVFIGVEKSSDRASDSRAVHTGQETKSHGRGPTVVSWTYGTNPSIPVIDESSLSKQNGQRGRTRYCLLHRDSITIQIIEIQPTPNKKKND